MTALAGFIGWRHGRKLREQGKTPEQVRVESRMSLPRIFFCVLLGIAIFHLVGYLDREYLWFSWLGGWSSQLGLVIIRSLMFLVVLHGVALEGNWAGMGKRFPLVVVLGVVITVFEITQLWPSALTISQEFIDKDGILRQTTGTTCGLCCLANINRLYGRNLSEMDASLIMRTGSFGSFGNEIADGAKATGFPEARIWQATLEQIASEDLPLVLSVKLFDDWDRHVVSLVGITSSSLIIADSLDGLVTVPKAGFENQWRGSCVRFGPPAFPCSGTIRLSSFDPERFRVFSPIRRRRNPSGASGTASQ